MLLPLLTEGESPLVPLGAEIVLLVGLVLALAVVVGILGVLVWAVRETRRYRASLRSPVTDARAG